VAKTKEMEHWKLTSFEILHLRLRKVLVVSTDGLAEYVLLLLGI